MRYYLVPHITSTHHLHGVVLVLRDALGGAELGPVPVSAVVAPPPPLAHQHVPGVAVKLDLTTRGMMSQLAVSTGILTQATLVPGVNANVDFRPLPGVGSWPHEMT